MTRARDLADSADKDIAGTITLDAVNASGVITGLTVEATGDTAAGDNAAMGYTAAEGLILTGQGSSGDITIKNDADAVVLQVPTGTTNVNVIGSLDVATNAVIDGTALVTGGATINGSAVFNEDHADVDFRVESDTRTHAFFVDGETGAVLIGSDATGLNAGTAASGRLMLQSLGNSAQLNMYRADSTITSGNDLAVITAYSNDTDGNSIEPLVQINMAADGTFNANDNPTRMVFSTTPDGSETMREVARFDNVGNLIIQSTGGTLITSTAGTSNFRAGANAGNSIASGGNYNVVVGDEAGTAITIADNNVAVGYQALLSSAEASNNTAIGINSMASHTGGVKNVGVGGFSLELSVNTAEQTAVGYEALKNSIGAGGGGGNTALGYVALRDTTTGVYNTALGYAAGYDGVLTGNYNTFAGALAGRNLAGDEDNSTFVGYSSGSLMTSGEKNVILGSFNGNQNNFNLIGVDSSIVISNGDGHPIINYQIAPDVIAMRGQTNGVNRLGVQGTLGMANGATYNVTTGNSGAQIIHIYDTGSGAGAIYFSNYGGTAELLASNGSVSFGVGASSQGYNLYKSANNHTVTFQNNSGATRNIMINVIGSAVSD